MTTGPIDGAEPRRPAVGGDGDSEKRTAHFWQVREIQWAAASGVLLSLAYLLGIAGLPSPGTTALYVLATLAGVRFFALEAAKEFIEERAIDIELLMAVATAVAAVLGLWGEAATLAFLYSISEALEEVAETRTRNAIAALMDLAPPRITLLDADGNERVVDRESLAIGDRFLVRPGESIATDGVVREGRSSVDESAVTGESLPLEKNPGGRVFAGTLNVDGSLTVEATATSEDDTLAKIVTLVMVAQSERGRGQRLMERFSAVYSPAVLGAGAVVVAAGGAITGGWSEWTIRAATLIVAAAPCALVISIPLTYVAAIGSAGRRGVLVKGGIVLEDLAAVRVVALDKTGTLTRGLPEMVSVIPADGYTEASVIAAAAGVERHSEHPVAIAIVQAADRRGLAPDRTGGFISLAGLGVEARLGEGSAIVGRPEMIRDRGIDTSGMARAVEMIEQAGRTAVMLAVSGEPRAVFGIADTPRAEARPAIQVLHASGIERVVMLTGDNPRAAEAVARELGIDEVHAGLMPDEKVARIAQLQERYGPVAMVGDGVNDAPALATAEVGIAMGVAGTDVALKTADVALMADDLSRLPEAVRIARRTRNVVRQNLVLSFTVLAVLVPMAVTGFVNLPVAVLGHELSELVVIASGLRMARA